MFAERLLGKYIVESLKGFRNNFVGFVSDLCNFGCSGQFFLLVGKKVVHSKCYATAVTFSEVVELLI